MIKLSDLTVVNIAEHLDKLTAESMLTEDSYCLLKELTRRQLIKQKRKINPKDLSDLAHIITVNILLFLSNAYKNNFKVTNWIKYVYNKAAKTATAMYVADGNFRTELIEFEDFLDTDSFIQRYFYTQLSPYYELEKFECEEGISNIGSMIPQLTKHLIRYNYSYKSYNLILYSAIFSVLKNKPVYLFGMTKKERLYVENLSNLVKCILPGYMKENLTAGSLTLNTYLTDLPNLLYYERLENEGLV